MKRKVTDLSDRELQECFNDVSSRSEPIQDKLPLAHKEAMLFAFSMTKISYVEKTKTGWEAVTDISQAEVNLLEKLFT